MAFAKNETAQKKRLSVLSDSPLQNEKFYFVAMITTCCRLCIEAGMISVYIRREKIGAAKYLLSYNDYSCTDIAEYLGFATESHFSSQFAKHEGMSPKEYRR